MGASQTCERPHCEHPEVEISFICLAAECNERFVCAKCVKTHNRFHSSTIIPLQTLFELPKDERIKLTKEFLDKREAYKKSMANHYKTALEKIKTEIEAQIEERKKYAEKYVEDNEFNSKDFMEFQDISVQISNLNEMSAKEYLKTDKGKTQVGTYVKQYLKIVNMINMEYSTLTSLSHKELQNNLNALLKVVDGAFDVFKDVYFGKKSFSQSNLRQKENENKFEQEVEIIEAQISDLNKNLKKDVLIAKMPEINPPKIESFDIKNMQLESKLKLKAPTGINSFDFIPSQECIVIGDKDGNLSLWNTKTWECILSEKVHDSSINVVKYSCKNKCIFTASDDYNIKVIKTKELSIIDEIVTLTNHTDKVWSLLLLEDHDTLYSSGKEAAVLGWDLTNLQLKHKIDTRGRDHTGTQMTFIPHLHLLAVSFKQGTISFYNTETPNEIRSINVLQNWIHCLKYIKERDELIVGHDSGTLKVFTIGDHEFLPKKEYKIPGKFPVCMESINNGTELLVSSNTNQLISLDLTTGQILNSFSLNQKEITSIKIVSSLRKIILGCFDGQIIILNY